MLDSLVLNNFPSGYKPALRSPNSGVFILMTCQRTLVLSYKSSPLSPADKLQKHETLTGASAYTFLLEITCGLQSKLIGENEIVGQFKTAYKNYVASENINSHLLIVIEKLFKDTKEIRTKYLVGLSQKTYSSITRKQIVGMYKAKKVLILGSGSLAEDLINQFKKKIDVYICARSSERVSKLVRDHGIQSIPWKDFNALSSFPYIANSIGCEHVILNEDFFQSWEKNHKNKLFVDLGSPSVINTQLSLSQGVMRLDDIFKEGAIHESHKKLQIEKAISALNNIVEKRHRLLKDKLNSQMIYNQNFAYV